MVRLCYYLLFPTRAVLRWKANSTAATYTLPEVRLLLESFYLPAWPHDGPVQLGCFVKAGV